MTVPRWAPQNQQSVSAGRDATNVGRDQHIQNIYHERAQGLTMSYPDFRDAIKEERADERAQTEDYFLHQLSIAYEDFTALQQERERLLAEFRSTRQSRTLRASVWFPVFVAVGALALGLFCGYGLYAIARPDSTSSASTPATPAATVTVTSEPKATAAATPTPVLVKPQLVKRPCGDGTVIQMGAVDPSEGAAYRDTRAAILADDLNYRLKEARRSERVSISLGTDYCYSATSPYADWLFLWIGPLQRGESDALCRVYRNDGVSVDCMVNPQK